MKKPMDTSSWFGKWTQLNDRDGKKVVVFLPEDQTGLQDKRTDFGQLIQVEDLILSGRLNDDIRQKAEESDRNPESVEPGNGRDEAGAGASPSVSSVTSKDSQPLRSSCRNHADYRGTCDACRLMDKKVMQNVSGSSRDAGEQEESAGGDMKSGPVRTGSPPTSTTQTAYRLSHRERAELLASCGRIDNTPGAILTVADAFAAVERETLERAFPTVRKLEAERERVLSILNYWAEETTDWNVPAQHQVARIKNLIESMNDATIARNALTAPAADKERIRELEVVQLKLVQQFNARAQMAAKLLASLSATVRSINQCGKLAESCSSCVEAWLAVKKDLKRFTEDFPSDTTRPVLAPIDRLPSAESEELCRRLCEWVGKYHPGLTGSYTVDGKTVDIRITVSK